MSAGTIIDTSYMYKMSYTSGIDEYSKFYNELVRKNNLIYGIYEILEEKIKSFDDTQDGYVIIDEISDTSSYGGTTTVHDISREEVEEVLQALESNKEDIFEILNDLKTLSDPEDYKRKLEELKGILDGFLGWSDEQRSVAIVELRKQSDDIIQEMLKGMKNKKNVSSLWNEYRNSVSLLYIFEQMSVGDELNYPYSYLSVQDDGLRVISTDESYHNPNSDEIKNLEEIHGN